MDSTTSSFNDSILVPLTNIIMTINNDPTQTQHGGEPGHCPFTWTTDYRIDSAYHFLTRNTLLPLSTVEVTIAKQTDDETELI